MPEDLEKFGTIAGIIAFLLCLVGGLVVIFSTLGILADDEDYIWVGMGLYFMGKAFFVGPMLLIASRALRAQEN